MLSFRWVLGDMTDNSPGEIPALLADLANADEEHVDVGFEKGDYGVGILVDLLRSEERRVGKECRSRWSPYH